MEQKSQFEHQLDPELLEEIEEWEQQETHRAGGILLL